MRAAGTPCCGFGHRWLVPPPAARWSWAWCGCARWPASRRLPPSQVPRRSSPARMTKTKRCRMSAAPRWKWCRTWTSTAGWPRSLAWHPRRAAASTEMRAWALSAWLLAVTGLVAVPRASVAQSAPNPPTQVQTSAPTPDANTTRQPLAWSSLDPDQQRMLAPLQSQWSQMPPERQQRLAAHATRWASLPPERQQRIHERLTRWAAMTPEQRRQLRQNVRAFHNLTPAERARVDAAFHRFQSLSPAERRALRERWHHQQRMRWDAGHAGHPIPMHMPAHRGH
ncbi:MAG: DUF3106 domain-containing protein [Rhodanobacteraceae bacterium]|nr:MAG: DUF3106 domain-containing protein [Rhodanobacteraceae bacterium]